MMCVVQVVAHIVSRVYLSDKMCLEQVTGRVPISTAKIDLKITHYSESYYNRIKPSCS